MNIIKKFMESGSKQDLVSIPAGQLFLIRSRQSPKSSSECLYNDATLAIRESGRYAYELVVRKFIEEELTSPFSGDNDDDDDELSVLSGQSKEDEWVFKLDATLHLHKQWNSSGDLTIAWRNTKGDKGEKFKFVVNSEISFGDIEQFLQYVYRCEYETKYQRPCNSASEQDLKQFDFSYLATDDATILFSDDDDVGDDDEVELREPEFLTSRFTNLSLKSSTRNSSDEEGADDLDDLESFVDALDEVSELVEEMPSPPTNGPHGIKRYVQYGDLFVYDPIVGEYAPQESGVKVAIIKLSEYEYRLYIEGKELMLETEFSVNMYPILDPNTGTFTFNYSYETVLLSYLIKFKTSALFNHFRVHWTIALWESLNRQPWSNLSEVQQQFVLNAAIQESENSPKFIQEDRYREDFYETLSENKPNTELDEDAYESETDSGRSVTASSFNDIDDYDEDKLEREYRESTSLSGNKSLTIGFRNDRSYVVRGNKIGVFKTNPDEDLEFVTSINNVSNLDGEILFPEKTMLYTEDRAMIIQDEKEKDKLYKMDLERGKIVDEWSANKQNIMNYAPVKKFDQLTNEQTFLGISTDSIFRMDPRISGKNKLVTADAKQYHTNNKFCSISSTESGLVAVGSEKGEIRLYNKINSRACTLIPALGQPIKHLCASADGKWLLATCQSNLLLIDTEIKTGNNAGILGYNKGFSRDNMPNMYVLRLEPATAMYMQQQSGQPINFTKATFNVSLNAKEHTISTSTGPFAMVWNLKDILSGKKTPYIVRKYDSNIMEEGFTFGSDKNIVVALKDDVSMAKKRSFRAPSKKLLVQSSSKKPKDNNTSHKK
ncbi:Vid27p Ecym_6451 [Eremothecium cymbalariae DBVPG|uniref:Vacuolar import/degradation Vid27 C-terminal domain-containing protein n=1 Tax=Eremothecium cymbalariae (strain CBS 270.75 / DBVPG 7215 / KCTC 17166 / NRRL Y-17582) TaxID=931890 RepID=G8JUP2_ERECY|nr:hypothetical protein Ecym_6451 [Eremothecium cymbalariae DBVPG\